MRIAILGGMGRDEALAERCGEHELHIISEWANPGLAEKAEQSGGELHVVTDMADPGMVAELVADISPNMFCTNSDNALGAGVVDAIHQLVEAKRCAPVLIPCPDKRAARIEWDKFYLRDLIADIAPELNPLNIMVDTPEVLNEVFDSFEQLGMEVVLKPRYLAGGKGVKVQGKHFDSYADGVQIARQILADPTQGSLEVQERLHGHEFTLQIMTDGASIALPPETYDYPYREDGDMGPGTGGMGTFSMRLGEHLPFVTQQDYDAAINYMNMVLMELRARSIDYKGVLYPTFFKTSDGLRLVEINARGGDPEFINILDLLEDDVDVPAVLASIAKGEFDPTSVRYKKLASAMIYLVSPEYGYSGSSKKDNPNHYDFNVDVSAITSIGVAVRFAAAKKIVSAYRTVGSSRTVGLSALAETPWEARDMLVQSITAGFGDDTPLQWRRDIGDQAYIEQLSII